MTNPYPIPRSARQTDVLLGNGGSIYGPFDGWRIFDAEDVEVWIKPASAVNFTKVLAEVTKISAQPLDYFKVAFASPVSATTKFLVRSARVAERSAGVDDGTRISMVALEKEMSKVASTLQELRRDVGRAVSSDFDQVPLMISGQVDEGQTLMRSGSALVGGPNLQALLDILQSISPEEAASLVDGGYYSPDTGGFGPNVDGGGF